MAEFSADAGAHFQVVCCVKGFEIYRWFIGPREMNPVVGGEMNPAIVVASIFMSVVLVLFTMLDRIKTRSQTELTEKELLRKQIQAMSWRVMCNKINTLATLKEVIRDKRRKKW